MSGFELAVLPGTLAICRLPANVPPPNWALAGEDFLAFVRTDTELSVVLPSGRAPEAAVRDDGWRALRVSAELELSLIGVLASLTTPLAEAEIPSFAISTHDTDYLLVKDDALEAARAALMEAGHRFVAEGAGTESAPDTEAR